MRFPHFALTAAALAFAAPAVMAQADSMIADELVLCMQHESDDARLACFDRLARRATAALEAGTSLGTRPTAIAPAAVPADAAQRSASSAASSAATATPAASPEAAFGLEQARDVERTADSIRSRVPGLFLGWTGDTVFRLENGQVWEQAESGSFGVRLENPEVEISRGWFGGYFLAVEGLNRRVRVKRVE